MRRLDCSCAMVVLLVCGFGAYGCMPSFIGSRFMDVKLSENRFVVRLVPGNDVAQEDLRLLMLCRAANIAVANGYDSFLVTGDEASSIATTVYSPKTSQYPAYATTYSKSDFISMEIVIMCKGQAAASNVYDAKSLQQNLGALPSCALRYPAWRPLLCNPTRSSGSGASGSGPERSPADAARDKCTQNCRQSAEICARDCVAARSYSVPNVTDCQERCKMDYSKCLLQCGE